MNDYEPKRHQGLMKLNSKAILTRAYKFNSRICCKYRLSSMRCVLAAWIDTMRCSSLLPIIVTAACLLFSGIGSAEAACTLPNLISNGQVADATAVMGDFNALVTCVETPNPVASIQLSGPGGGVVSLQNPNAASDYKFNLPATPGADGSLYTSGGGSNNPGTWTSTGTSGHALPYLDGGNSWSGTQTFGPVVGAVSTQEGTSYTLTSHDCGTTIRFTNSSPATLTTLNSLAPGCSIAVEQAGAGQITIAAGAGTTQHSPHNYAKTYGIYAILGLFVDQNSSGTAAEFIITGDGT